MANPKVRPFCRSTLKPFPALKSLGNKRCFPAFFFPLPLAPRAFAVTLVPLVSSRLVEPQEAGGPIAVIEKGQRPEVRTGVPFESIEYLISKLAGR